MISQEEVVTKTDSSNFAPHPAPPRAQQPFTPEEVSRIQTQLDAPIDNEYIQFRPSAQGSVGYVEGWKALSLMNEVFGFNGWSSEILHLGTDFTDIHDDRISLGMFCMVRIHLRDGTFHDDIGYGSAENQRSKAAAFEKARKEAVTDAMKRGLRVFGSRLGNCAYDKRFLQQVRKGQSSGHRPPAGNLPPLGNQPNPPTSSTTLDVRHVAMSVADHSKRADLDHPVRLPHPPPSHHQPQQKHPQQQQQPPPPQPQPQQPPPDFVPKWQHPRAAMAPPHNPPQLAEPEIEAELLLTEERTLTARRPVYILLELLEFGSSFMDEKLDASPSIPVASRDLGMPRTRPKLFNANLATHARPPPVPRAEPRAGNGAFPLPAPVPAPTVSFRPTSDPSMQK